MGRARTWDLARMRRGGAPSNDPELSSPRQSWLGCIIAMPGYNFRKGQGCERQCLKMQPLCAAAFSVNVRSVDRLDFATSAPAVLMAAIAKATHRIRLTSVLTVLSAADPVRVFEDIATVELISKGRESAGRLRRRSGMPSVSAYFGCVTRNPRASLVDGDSCCLDDFSPA